jgi:hypothetical protein
VPHGLPEAVATEAGAAIVRDAVLSLNQALERASTLPAEAFNLLGFEGGDWQRDLEPELLRDVGRAFLDLLDGRMVGANHDCVFMPGEQTR